MSAVEPWRVAPWGRLLAEPPRPATVPANVPSSVPSSVPVSAPGTATGTAEPADAHPIAEGQYAQSLRWSLGEALAAFRIGSERQTDGAAMAAWRTSLEWPNQEAGVWAAAAHACAASIGPPPWSGAQLRQWIRRSGLATEARLAASIAAKPVDPFNPPDPSAPFDLKQVFAAGADGSPSSGCALRWLESAQWAALEAQLHGEVDWRFTVPWPDRPPILVRWWVGNGREPSRAPPADRGRGSAMRLALPLSEVSVQALGGRVGPLWLRAQWRTLEQLALQVWVERPEMEGVVRAGLEPLCRQGSAHGMQVRSLQIHTGQGPSWDLREVAAVRTEATTPPAGEAR